MRREACYTKAMPAYGTDACVPFTIRFQKLLRLQRNAKHWIGERGSLTIFDLDKQLDLPEKTVICLGFFDGVHIGHARLIQTALQVAAAQSLRVCVHTFAEMPLRYFCASEAIHEITPLAEKARLFESLGVDILAVSHFDHQMAHMRAADFFQDILIHRLRAAHIVVGFHHRFGYQSEADTEALASLCEAHGVGLSIVPPVYTQSGGLVSSTAIREAIARGDFYQAEEMLGRPYSASPNLVDRQVLR